MSANGEQSKRSGMKSVDVGSDDGTEQLVRKNRELCGACQSLELDVHRFKVQASRNASASSADRSLRSSNTARRLGSLFDIRTRSRSCPLCALILDSVEELSNQGPSDQPVDSAAEQQLQQAVCSISWEIDGRESSSPTKSGGNPRNTVRGLTRRIRIRWNHPRLSDAYIVYVAPENYSQTASDADRVWDKDSLFLGRKVAPDIENQALIRSWLDLCQQTHRGPCRQQVHTDSEDFHNMISHSYFGVVDVQHMQLTQLPYSEATGSSLNRHSRYQAYEPMNQRIKHEPYVALSYVWGTDKSAYTTLTKNVMLHRMHGGLEKVLRLLPKVIQDAIDLVRRLGFKYLWIDRLCIVQDSPRSWKLNAYNMDLIYGNAELTICAADGDASAGLQAMRSATRNIKQYRRTVASELHLMVTRPPEMYIRASKWNERAWTFQERLLSRRCLVFTNGRVHFQCRSTCMSEDIYADRKGAGWSLDLVDAPMQMFRQLDNRAVWVYMRCVELYTERKLTQSKDILAAFSGMSNLMHERMQSPFIHGLPSSHFDLALLWEPTKAAERRIIADEENHPSIPSFPSWSWAGWAGKIEYKHSIIGGVLDNVSDWLDSHTWIKWWVRDGYGDLRPLWDDSVSKLDESEDAAWRGYSRRRTQRYGGVTSSSSRLPRENEQYEPEVSYYGTATRDEGVYGTGNRPPKSVYRSSNSRGMTRDSAEDNDDYSSSSSGTGHYDGVREDARNGETGGVRRLIRHDTDLTRTRHSGLIDDYTLPHPSRSSPVPGRARSYYNSPPGQPPLPPSLPLPIHGPQSIPPAIRNRMRYTSPPASPSRRSYIPVPTRTTYPGYDSPPPSDEIRINRMPQPSSPVRRKSVHYTSAGRDSSPPSHARRRSDHSRHLSALSEHPTHTSQFFDMFFENDGEEFSITLRDYPYRVVKAPFDPSPDSLDFPLLPILQFRTWHTWLYIKPATAATDQNKRASMDIGIGQVRSHIADEVGDWCGSIVLDTGWVAKAATKHEFIAISDAKNFTLAECREWTYYIPKGREQSEWDLFYVLLIERKEERWERIGVGKVFKEAFRSARWKEIMLG